MTNLNTDYGSCNVMLQVFVVSDEGFFTLVTAKLQVYSAISAIIPDSQIKIISFEGKVLTLTVHPLKIYRWRFNSNYFTS